MSWGHLWQAKRCCQKLKKVPSRYAATAMATQISQRAPQTCKFHLQIKLSNSQHIFPLSPISVFPPCGHVSEIANQLCRENGRGKRRVGETVQGHSWSLKCRCEDSLRQLIMRLVVLVALVVPPIRTKTLKSQGNRGGGRRRET